jgi:hypothetical protein
VIDNFLEKYSRRDFLVDSEANRNKVIHSFEKYCFYFAAIAFIFLPGTAYVCM